MKLNEYEKRRLENIKKNNAILESLGIENDVKRKRVEFETKRIQSIK